MNENISSVRSEIFPSLFLSATHQTIKNYNEYEFDNEKFNNNQSINLNLSIPIFNGLGSVARIQKAKAEYQKSKYMHYDLKEYLSLELKTLLLNLEFIKKKVFSVKKEIEMSKAALESAKILLETGKITPSEMEESELIYLESQLRLLQHKLEHQNLLSALDRLIGREEAVQ